jgi:hypothetical protein
MATSETRTYTIQNLSTVSTTINSMVFTNEPEVSHHLGFPAVGWVAPYAGVTDFTANSTEITETALATYALENIPRPYISNTGTSLTVSSNANIGAGYAVNGNGYNTTVVSTAGTQTVVTSAGPTTTPIFNDNILFLPPQYDLIVDDNAGISANWTAAGNNYSGQTVVATSGSTYLIMSGPPNGTPTPGGVITFTSDQNLMLTLAPGSTATFTAYYSNNSAVTGSYTGTFLINATQFGSVIKIVKNAVGINTDPIFVDGGGGGGDYYYGGGDGFSPGDNPGEAPAAPADGINGIAGNPNASEGGTGETNDGGVDGNSAVA